MSSKILVAFALILLGCSLDVSHGSKAGQTKYGCEGQVLEISCERDSVIELVRANFGRFSISICNDKGEADWSVDCMQPKTLRIIKSICDNKRECSFPVNSTQFEDPCPGTPKYVEVHYSCRPLQLIQPVQSTTHSIPPWLLALTATSAASTSSSAPPSTSTSTMTSTTTTATTSRSSSTTTTTPGPSSTSTTTTSTLESLEANSQNEMSSNLFTYLEEEEYLLPPGGDFAQFCTPLTSRSLFWNWTAAGSEAVQVCPMSTRGFARWKCLENGQWSSESPDLGECQSIRITRLEDRLKEQSRVLDISSELAVTTETKSLYGGDLYLISKMIRTLSHKLRQNLYTLNKQIERENQVARLLQNVLKTASNLLLDFQDLAWKDLMNEPDKRTAVANSLILGVEDASLLLAETMDTEKNLVEATHHILSSVRIMKSRYVTDQEFPGPVNTPHFPLEELRIMVPASVLYDNGINGAIRVSFFLYDKMDEILSPPPSDLRFINSKVAGVIASSEDGRNNEEYLREPVEVTLRHLQSEGVHHTSCASWEYYSKTWTTEHCHSKYSNLTHTTCSCSKMALYALLSQDLPHSLLDSPTYMQEGQGSSHPSEDEGTQYLAALISSLVALIMLIVAVILLLVFLRKRLDVEGLKSADVFSSCLICKRKKQTPAAPGGGSGGFYPASAMLSSSPTSTTISGGGTPTSYLEQILNNESKRISKPMSSGGDARTLMPQYKSSLLLKTNNLSQTLPQQHHQLNGFRPVSPFGHIYMEIDPVYSHLQDSNSGRASEISSDILQLSDLSDDDIMKKCYASNTSGSSGISSVTTMPYAEERPLISSHGFGSARQFNSQHHHNSISSSSKPMFTPHRGAPSRGGSIRPQVYPAPLSIALQGGDQFVSLQIDKHSQHVHPGSNNGLVFSDI